MPQTIVLLVSKEGLSHPVGVPQFQDILISTNSKNHDRNMDLRVLHYVLDDTPHAGFLVQYRRHVLQKQEAPKKQRKFSRMLRDSTASLPMFLQSKALLW